MSFVHDDKDFDALLRIVAGKRKISVGLVEKDYWVTHVLWRFNRVSEKSGAIRTTFVNKKHFVNKKSSVNAMGVRHRRAARHQLGEPGRVAVISDE